MTAWSWHEWVFSGIGTAAAGFLGTRIIRLLRAKKTPVDFLPNLDHSTKDNHAVDITGRVVGSAIIAAPVSESRIALGDNIDQSIHVHQFGSPERRVPDCKQTTCTEPSPDQIMRDIDSVLPFDRVQAYKKYQELPIIWELVFTGISELSTGMRIVHLRDDRWRSFCFCVSHVPQELQVAPAGSTVMIEGEIELVDAVGFHLKQDPQILRVKRPEKPE